MAYGKSCSAMQCLWWLVVLPRTVLSSAKVVLPTPPYSAQVSKLPTSRPRQPPKPQVRETPGNHGFVKSVSNCSKCKIWTDHRFCNSRSRSSQRTVTLWKAVCGWVLEPATVTIQSDRCSGPPPPIPYHPTTPLCPKAITSGVFFCASQVTIKAFLLSVYWE